ncbi:MAG TPA: hypothetical protein VES39_09985 [Rhodospirillales bacterium]|nr:hypothetical protein [Rhodospirillales bacterium]
MGKIYVSRDAQGRIDGVFGNYQHGYATEPLDDQSAEVLAFMADTSIYRRAGSARRARRFARALDRDPLAALIERARQETKP